jgi:hypothetical protein
MACVDDCGRVTGTWGSVLLFYLGLHLKFFVMKIFEEDNGREAAADLETLRRSQAEE